METLSGFFQQICQHACAYEIVSGLVDALDRRPKDGSETIESAARIGLPLIEHGLAWPFIGGARIFYFESCFRGDASSSGRVTAATITAYHHQGVNQGDCPPSSGFERASLFFHKDILNVFFEYKWVCLQVSEMNNQLRSTDDPRQRASLAHSFAPAYKALKQESELRRVVPSFRI